MRILVPLLLVLLGLAAPAAAAPIPPGTSADYREADRLDGKVPYDGGQTYRETFIRPAFDRYRAACSKGDAAACAELAIEEDQYLLYRPAIRANRQANAERAASLFEQFCASAPGHAGCGLYFEFLDDLANSDRGAHPANVTNGIPAVRGRAGAIAARRCLALFGKASDADDEYEDDPCDLAYDLLESRPAEVKALAQQLCARDSAQDCHEIGRPSATEIRRNAEREKACSTGTAKSCADLAMFWMDAKWSSDQGRNLREWSVRGCKLGNGISCLLQAQTLTHGQGVAKDLPAAAKLLGDHCRSTMEMKDRACQLEKAVRAEVAKGGQ